VRCAMAPPPRPFVDHYAVLGDGLSPETPFAEVKKAYHEKLRTYHPDKRGTTSGFGVRQTQALNEAWNVLKHPEVREAYDATWHQKKGPPAASAPSASGPGRPSGAAAAAAPSGASAASAAAAAAAALEAAAADAAAVATRRTAEKAEQCRRDGNALYKEATAIVKREGMSEEPAHRFEAAIAKYSEGIRLAPKSFQLRSNRALCHMALGDFAQCRADALKVTRIQPDFMKGWFLLVKATWKEDCAAAALPNLQKALEVLPGCSELVALKAEMLADMERLPGENVRLPPVCGVGSRSQHPTPSVTPCTSRCSTPQKHSGRRNYSKGSRRGSVAGPEAETLPPISKPHPPRLVVPAALRAASDQASYRAGAGFRSPFVTPRRGEDEHEPSDEPPHSGPGRRQHPRTSSKGARPPAAPAPAPAPAPAAL